MNFSDGLLHDSSSCRRKEFDGCRDVDVAAVRKQPRWHYNCGSTPLLTTKDSLGKTGFRGPSSGRVSRHASRTLTAAVVGLYRFLIPRYRLSSTTSLQISSSHLKSLPLIILSILIISPYRARNHQCGPSKRVSLCGVLAWAVT